jgi:ribosomal protein S18 acetylase RimI-like enzyme
VVTIRSARIGDAAAIAVVQRASWFAAYQGIVPHDIIDEFTMPDDGARMRQVFRMRPWQHTIVAEAPPAQPSGTPPPAQPCGTPPPAQPSGTPLNGIVGYASFGPERDVLHGSWPYQLTPAGLAGETAELYAFYVHPGWWSTGSGRALMERVLRDTARSRFPEVVLWVLEKNARARRFYERAGFCPDGAVNVLVGLGGVPEVRYRRAL